MEIWQTTVVCLRGRPAAAPLPIGMPDGKKLLAAQRCQNIRFDFSFLAETFYNWYALAATLLNVKLTTCRIRRARRISKMEIRRGPHRHSRFDETGPPFNSSPARWIESMNIFFRHNQWLLSKRYYTYISFHISCMLAVDSERSQNRRSPFMEYSTSGRVRKHGRASTLTSMQFSIKCMRAPFGTYKSCIYVFLISKKWEIKSCIRAAAQRSCLASGIISFTIAATQMKHTSPQNNTNTPTVRHPVYGPTASRVQNHIFYL